MKPPVVIMGMGELGGEFARGFLRCGYPVVPVLRRMNPVQVAQEIPRPELVLVAVSETDLDPVLAGMPTDWCDCLVLVQNELTPADWERQGLENVTVAVVWFEKKPGRPLTDILFTPAHGPKSGVVLQALDKLGIRTRHLVDADELVFELARKSLYILTLNISALVVEASAGEIWHRHRELTESVAREVLQILELRFARVLPKEALIDAMVVGIEDCPDRPARGRRARERLQRVLEEARRAGLRLPVVERIAQDCVG